MLDRRPDASYVNFLVFIKETRFVDEAVKVWENSLGDLGSTLNMWFVKFSADTVE